MEENTVGFVSYKLHQKEVLMQKTFKYKKNNKVVGKNTGKNSNAEVGSLSKYVT